MGKEKKHGHEKRRRQEMGQVLGNIFHNINRNSEGFQNLRKAVERDLEFWNEHYIEGITLTDLEDFLWEVAACIFGVGQAVDKLLKTKWDGEGSDKTHWDEFISRFEELDTECNHTLDGSKKILQDMGYNEREIEEICDWFEEHGGYCDCEVHLNIILREERWIM